MVILHAQLCTSVYLDEHTLLPFCCSTYSSDYKFDHKRLKKFFYSLLSMNLYAPLRTTTATATKMHHFIPLADKVYGMEIKVASLFSNYYYRKEPPFVGLC